ncbi:type II toxin-antitoxin system HicB family antitoxin [Natrialbaceae archaeon A-CW3]
MASSAENGESRREEIRLWREDDWWIATDVASGITTQGHSRTVALANLDEAIALQNGTIGDKPTEAELREMGIDPEDNTTGTQEPPDVLK